MRCDEVIAVLKELAPEQLACDWDNPGLLAGRSDKEVKTIYLALDATDQVIEDAVSAGADLLVTHHPLIFKAMKKINDQDFIGRRVLRMIQAVLPDVWLILLPGVLGLLNVRCWNRKESWKDPYTASGRQESLPFPLLFGNWLQR